MGEVFVKQKSRQKKSSERNFAMQIRTMCKQKIKSESGASLAAALLFFVVCTVVGSIIIAAAMTSAGRIENITSADTQRYALDSARNLVEDTMLSDPEDDDTWYVNKNERQATAASYVNGFTPKNGSLTSQLDSFREVELSMAEELYHLYWEMSEIQESWPQEESTAGTQASGSQEALAAATVAAETDVLGQDGIINTETLSSWVPSGKIVESKYPRRRATLTLTGNGISSGDIPAVTAVFVMQPDFSIHITLSVNTSSKENTSSLTEEEFVLHPTIFMDYESVKSETDSGALTTMGNTQNIYCVIQWLNEEEEQPEQE